MRYIAARLLKIQASNILRCEVEQVSYLMHGFLWVFCVIQCS
jgi:hypothetical protein